MKGDYMRKLIGSNMRADDRKFDQFREISVEKGVIKTAEGSACVKIGETELVVGVKMAVREPYPDTPNEGAMMVDAEFVPFANPEFEPGPPGPAAVELARVVDRAIRESKAIDTEKLCITPGESVWALNIDISIVNHDGNLIDAASLGAMAALQDVRMPEYDSEKKQVKKEGNTIIYSKKKLPLKDSPVEVTVAKINGKLLVDLTNEEETALDARVTFGITAKGYICAIQKGGTGFFTAEELVRAAELALEKSKELRALLK